MEKPWLEGKIKSSIHPEMDKWLSAVDKLSKAIAELNAAKERFKQKITTAKKDVKKVEKPNKDELKIKEKTGKKPEETEAKKKPEEKQVKDKPVQEKKVRKKPNQKSDKKKID